MIRLAALFLLGWVYLITASAQPRPDRTSNWDRAFNRVPFDQWVAAGEKAQIKWEPRIREAFLSPSQRLISRVEIKIDGDEVAKRRGRGGLVMFVQYADGKGNPFRTHSVMDLRKISQETNKLDFVFSQEFFVLPGEYRVALAMYDTQTAEYSFTEKPFRVGALKNDPLPRMWDGLPPVAVRGGPRVQEPEPDENDDDDPSYARRLLNLPVKSRSPIHLQLLANIAPSISQPDRRLRPIPTDITLGRVLSSFQVLTELKVPLGKFDISLADITKRRVVYQQDGAAAMDWDAVQTALKIATPQTIDAGVLRNRGKTAQFFVEQVRKRVPPLEAAKEAATEPKKVLIVLSAPYEFEGGEDRSQIEGGIAPGSVVFFVRQHVMPPRAGASLFEEPRFGRRTLPSPIIGARSIYQEPVDELHGTIKPVRPRVFDVYTPEDFRKALAQIIEEIAKI